MWHRRSKLLRLREELHILSVFERLENYPLVPADGKDGKRYWRERRHSELLEQIAALEGKDASFHRRYTKNVAAVLLIAATAYGAFHQLFR